VVCVSGGQGGTSRPRPGFSFGARAGLYKERRKPAGRRRMQRLTPPTPPRRRPVSPGGRNGLMRAAVLVATGEAVALAVG